MKQHPSTLLQWSIGYEAVLFGLLGFVAGFVTGFYI